jgi:F-type H+-transporting ATPase subunit epsilon
VADPLEVRLVAADREVWSGEATTVIARTTEGEIGVLPGHAPLLGVLVNGAVRIRQAQGGDIEAAVHGGFLSIADNQVAVLAEVAELAEDIDVERARRALEEAQRGTTDRDSEDGDDDERQAAIARAETRLRVAGR